MMQIVAEIVIIGVSEMTMIVMTDEKVDKWIVVIMELKIVVVILVELALELMLIFMMFVLVIVILAMVEKKMNGGEKNKSFVLIMALMVKMMHDYLNFSCTCIKSFVVCNNLKQI